MSETKTSTLRASSVIVRCLIVALALASGVICCVFVNDVIGYAPLIMVVAGIIAALIYILCVRHAVTVDDAERAYSCERGDVLPFKVHFVNHSRLPLARVEVVFTLTNVTGATDSHMHVCLALAPREELDYGFDVAFNHIGTCEVRLESLRVYDPLCLFYSTNRCQKTYVIAIAPHRYPLRKLAEFAISKKESQKQSQPIVTDDMDYAGVRDYVPGDPIKAIHWKLSARTDHYFTRLFEMNGTPGLSVFVDTSSPAYDKESLLTVYDGVVEAAFSSCAYAVEHGMDGELVFCGEHKEIVRLDASACSDTMRVLKCMPCISSSTDPRLLIDAIAQVSGRIDANDNLIVCSGNVTDDLCMTLIETKERRKCPVLVAIVPPDIDQKDRKKLAERTNDLNACEIPVYIVDRAAKLSEGVA